jgi:uncharacterized membrane protein YsdA (DUF1294 family)
MMGSLALAIILVYWISVATLIALIIMGIDKLAARFHRRRISEGALWLLAIVGGFPGIILGAQMFHHKVRKRSFWLPVAIAIVLWTIAFLYAG